MEPIFAEPAGDTVTAELRVQLDAAVAALPPAHRLNPTENEPTDSRDAALARLQDWAFTKGFALVTESAKTHKGRVVRVYLECVHHKKETKNCRKFTEEEWQRVQTKSQSNGCKFSIRIYDNEAPAEPGSQAQPLEILSSDSGDDEPRRSGRVKRSTRVLESQQW
jgi:hypothetical protein